MKDVKDRSSEPDMLVELRDELYKDFGAFTELLRSLYADDKEDANQRVALMRSRAIVASAIADLALAEVSLRKAQKGKDHGKDHGKR